MKNAYFTGKSLLIFEIFKFLYFSFPLLVVLLTTAEFKEEAD